MNEGWSIWYAIRQLLSTQWKLLLVFIAVGAMLGSLYGMRQSTTYVARSEIVTGTYSLPINIGTASVVDKAGPLSLELPAETQARIISSPAIVNVAADSLGLTEDERTALANGVKSSPTTDNSFAITAPGSTAQKAADSANAIAKAYLAYRTEVGRGELNRLSEQAKGQAASSTSAARAMDPAISNALSNPSYASTLLTRQQELERSAASASASADHLNAMSMSFTGGGAILQPATATMAAKSVGIIMYLAIGTVAGLALGILISAARRQFSDRILDRQDIIRATGFRAVFSTQGKGISSDQCSLLLRIADNDTNEAGQSGTIVAFRSIGHGSGSEELALQLAAAAMTQNRHVAAAMMERTGAEKALITNARDEHGAAWDELSADDLVVFEQTTGLKAAGVLVSPGSGHSLDLVVAVAGDCSSDVGVLGGLPSTFDGPIFLVVQANRDRTSLLNETVQQIESAGLTIAAIVLVSRSHQRARTGRYVAESRGRRMVHRQGVTAQTAGPLSGPTLGGGTATHRDENSQGSSLLPETANQYKIDGWPAVGVSELRKGLDASNRATGGALR